MLRKKINISISSGKMIKSSILTLGILLICWDSFVLNYGTVYCDMYVDQEIHSPSKGKEVRINRIQIGNRGIELSELELPEGWYYLENEKQLISYGESKVERLSFPVRRGDEIHCDFVSYEWGGRVGSIQNEKLVYQDLYSAISKDICLAFTPNRVEFLMKDAVMPLLAFGVCVFLIAYFLFGTPLK